jgi:DNA-binding MarR family transcriptional regulator
VNADERRRKQIPLSDADYQAIAAFRAVLRRFLHFSEEAARAAGISPQQHQLLLAIRGYAGEGEAPSIGELAEALQIRHHSAVGLVDRLETAGLVSRSTAETDARKVFVHLTSQCDEVLAGLTSAHRREHRELSVVLEALLHIEDGPSFVVAEPGNRHSHS